MTTSYGNLVMGFKAGQSATGNDNVIIGHEAGAEATGSLNMFIVYMLIIII